MRVGGFLDLAEFGDAGEIDEQIGLDEPQIEHRPERLPAGEKLDRDVVAGAERQGGGDVAGALVVEGDRLHGALLPAAAIASRMRRGRDRRDEEFGAERPQGIVHGVGDGGGRGDGAALADALDAELGVGRERLHMVEPRLGHLGRARQKIVGKGRGERLSRLSNGISS